MEKLLDFMYVEARANMAFHITNGEAISKEANTFLNLLLGAGSGLFALMISLSQKKEFPEWMAGGLIAASVYCFVITGVLVWKCLWIQNIAAPANEPKNFPLDPQYLFDDIREIELMNLQGRIDRNKERNLKAGSWLNRCRGFAAGTPILGGVSAWVGWAGWGL